MVAQYNTIQQEERQDRRSGTCCRLQIQCSRVDGCGESETALAAEHLRVLRVVHKQDHETENAWSGIQGRF